MMASGGFLSSPRTSVADLAELEVRAGPAIQTPFSAATSGCIGVSANTITRTQHRSGEAVADVSAQERRCNSTLRELFIYNADVPWKSCLAVNSEQLKPLSWVKTADGSLASTARFCLRTCETGH